MTIRPAQGTVSLTSLMPNDGHLVKRLISNGQLAQLPVGLWRGYRISSVSFTTILVTLSQRLASRATFGDGKINAFDINSGAFY